MIQVPSDFFGVFSNSYILSTACFGVISALSRYASAHNFIHLSISSLLLRLENMMILHSSEGANSLMILSVSNQSIEGIIISSRIIFGLNSVTSVIAVNQLSAIFILNHSFSNFSLYIVASSISSSTMSIFISFIDISLINKIN